MDGFWPTGGAPTAGQRTLSGSTLAGAANVFAVARVNGGSGRKSNGAMNNFVLAVLTPSAGAKRYSLANLFSAVRINGGSGRKSNGNASTFAVALETGSGYVRRGRAAALFVAAVETGFAQVRRGSPAALFAVDLITSARGARRGATAAVLDLAMPASASGSRHGGNAATLAVAQEKASTGKRSGGAATVLEAVMESGSGYVRRGRAAATMCVVIAANYFGERRGGVAKIFWSILSTALSARVPPVIVDPIGKRIMRNRIRLLENNRQASRGLSFDGGNCFSLKLTPTEATRLEVYYDHLLIAGDYLISAVVTTDGAEAAPIVSLNLAGTIATMTIPGGGQARNFKVVGTTFFGLADEINLRIGDYRKPSTRPSGYCHG